MVTITFPDRQSERRALAFLLGRFSGRLNKTGEHFVPAAALEALADQGIPFSVKGIATDEEIAAEPKLSHPDLPPDAKPAPMEAHLARLRRRPVAVAGVVENGLVRPSTRR